MCANCVTAAEALAISMAGATAAGNELRRVIQDAFRGRPAFERRIEAWQANAAFLSSLGLDPVEVLGAPPAPSTAPVHVAPSQCGDMSVALA